MSIQEHKVFQVGKLIEQPEPFSTLSSYWFGAGGLPDLSSLGVNKEENPAPNPRQQAAAYGKMDWFFSLVFDQPLTLLSQSSFHEGVIASRRPPGPIGEMWVGGCTTNDLDQIRREKQTPREIMFLQGVLDESDDKILSWDEDSRVLIAAKSCQMVFTTLGWPYGLFLFSTVDPSRMDIGLIRKRYVSIEFYRSKLGRFADLLTEEWQTQFAIQGSVLTALQA